MPYTLTKQEKAAIKRQYLENIRIMNQYLPDNLKIRPNYKALNRRLDNPKEQRFYKKSLEVNRREEFKINESARIRAKYEPTLRVKNRPDPFDRLMHCELAASNSPEAQKYNELKIQNYYRHPEAEAQRRLQKLANLDLSPLAKAVKSNDLDNFLLDFYEKNNTAIEDAYCYERTVGRFPKDALTPEMKQYYEPISKNYEMLVSINDKVARVKEGYYFSIPELNEAQQEEIINNFDFERDHNELFTNLKARTIGQQQVDIALNEFKTFINTSEELGYINQKGYMGKVVSEQKSTGKICSLSDITNKKYKGNMIPEVKVLNEQEQAGVQKMFNTDYTKEKGFLNLDLPPEFQKPWAVRAKEELLFNYALDNRKSLAEVENKSLGGIAESFTGNWKETIFRTTSREYKNFIKAMKNFDKSNKIGEYQNGGRVITTANTYLMHRGVRTMEQALALPEPQRSRCVFCLNSINTFQKYADSSVQKVVPGTLERLNEEPQKKNDWPAAIEDASLVNDNVIEKEDVIDTSPQKENVNVIEEEKVIE